MMVCVRQRFLICGKDHKKTFVIDRLRPSQPQDVLSGPSVRLVKDRRVGRDEVFRQYLVSI